MRERKVEDAYPLPGLTWDAAIATLLILAGTNHLAVQRFCSCTVSQVSSLSVGCRQNLLQNAEACHIRSPQSEQDLECGVLETRDKSSPGLRREFTKRPRILILANSADAHVRRDPDIRLVNLRPARVMDTALSPGSRIRHTRKRQ